MVLTKENYGRIMRGRADTIADIGKSNFFQKNVFPYVPLQDSLQIVMNFKDYHHQLCSQSVIFK